MIATRVVPEQSGTKLPFKLIPVEPPKKTIDVKTTTTAATSTIRNGSAEQNTLKVKIRSKSKVVIQRRALSPVPEDTGHSSVSEHQQSNIGLVVAACNQNLQLEESMDFETIDEQNLSVLTEGSAITFSQEVENPVISTELQDLSISQEDSEATQSIIINTSAVSTLSSAEQTIVEDKAIPVPTFINVEVLGEQTTSETNLSDVDK